MDPAGIGTHNPWTRCGESLEDAVNHDAAELEGWCACLRCTEEEPRVRVAARPQRAAHGASIRSEDAGALHYLDALERALAEE
jgi:hypothetical protein